MKHKCEHDDNILPTKPPKAPKHSQIHLPLLNTPSIKPRYKILKSPQRDKNDLGLGRLNSSLTPTSSESRRHFPSINSSRSINSNESCSNTPKSDIEKIIQDQFYTKSKLNKLIRSSETPLIEEKNRSACRVKSEEGKIKTLPHLDDTFLTPTRSSPVKKKKIIIPDIPKAKFGVHKSYNELNVNEDFKTIEIVDKPREAKFRSRDDSLEKEQGVRAKILVEILSSSRNCY